jgi:hypothetical protein
VVGCLAGLPCRPLDAHDSAEAGLGCRSVDSCCGEVMLEGRSWSSNCQVLTVLAVSGGAACRLSVYLPQV